MNDPAVLEAQRRRSVREMRQERELTIAHQDYTLTKVRSHWLLMGLIPGMAAWPVILLSAWLLGTRGASISASVLLCGGCFWVAYCSMKMALARRRGPVWLQLVAGAGTWLVLMVANCVLVYLLVIMFLFLVAGVADMLRL